MIRLTVAALGLALFGSFLPADALAQVPKPAAPATVPTPAPKAAAPDESGFKDFKQKISYTIGIEMARNFKLNGVEVDTDVFLQGVKDGFGDGKVKLTDAQIIEIKQQFQEQMMAKQAEMQAKSTEKFKKEGADFLKANAAKPGVTTTASGLQYIVLKEGTGASPKATNTVKAHYKGTLIDGTPFDSSYDRGQPASFGLSMVIPGWTEGVPLMKVGGKSKFFIPFELAYGPNGREPKIPPYSALIFEIELLAIEK